MYRRPGQLATTLVLKTSFSSKQRVIQHSVMSTQAPPIDGIVVGVQGGKLAAEANSLTSHTSIDVASQWATSRASSTKPGQLRVFYPSSANEAVVAAVSIASDTKAAPSTGPDSLSTPDTFLRNEHLEETRVAAAKGARALKELPLIPAAKGDEAEGGIVRRTIAVDSFTSPHAAATGSLLSLWKVNHFKSKGPGAAFGKEYELQGGRDVKVVPLAGEGVDAGDEVKDSTVPLSWKTGEVFAEAQNWARELGETPANLMTPTNFCKVVMAKLTPFKNVSAIAHDEEWAKAKGMGSFLSVTHGSDEPCKMLEIHYKGAGQGKPTLALVGKGITFDTGGYALKPALNMKLMRCDMGGGAACVSTVYAVAKLGIPVNIVCVVPLTENLINGHATKPGDLVQAMNGLTIDVDNPDAEGRLVLADALTYASREFKPAVLIDVATLTGAILHALGHEYTGAFVEDDRLWHALKDAGEAEADPFWRMPLADRFYKYIDTSYSDVVNVGRPAGSASAAIFLKQFVEGLEDRSKGKPATLKYAHLDIAGTMEAIHSSPYQDKGLTGRPVRALIEFARRFAVKPEM